MKKIVVSIVVLGSVKHSIDMRYMEGWKSNLFVIKHGFSIGHLPDADGHDWQYTNQQLLDLIRPDPDADVTVAIINAPLECNYYMRRISDKVGVLSLFEMADILHSSDFSIEHYIIRNIYEMIVIYASSGGLIPDDAYSWAHHDVRGCLFDMNANKFDIVFSMHKPSLCESCRSRVKSKQVGAGFLINLENELRRIKKSLYFRVNDWIRANPFYALASAAVFSSFINIASSVIFEKLKSKFPWII